MSEFGDKVRTVAVIRGRSTPRIREGRDAAGNPFRAVTDERGNTVTEWDDHHDVTIRAPRITAKATAGD
jgi:hypothetical protein